MINIFRIFMRYLFASLLMWGVLANAHAQSQSGMATMEGMAGMSAMSASAPNAESMAKPAEPPAVGVASAVPAAPATPAKPEKGDVAWSLVATLLVLLMSMPGLALFYGGMVRKKNMLSILMQTSSIFAVVVVLWAVFGYSIAFTENNNFFGGMSRLWMQGMTLESTVATFSKGVVLPEFSYFAFQAVFAAIACALIIGGLAERVKFSALLLFVVFWFVLAYLPVAHMVWYWAGPDAYSSAEAATAATLTAGQIFQWGALDFAGGTVIHINAGVAALVGAWMIGPRIGFGKEALTPHSLAMTMIGAGMLWVGWFGFNAGSALESNAGAALAFVNTLLAPASALLGWILMEVLRGKQPSLLGAVSGIVVGLVVITPACGFVGPMGAIAMGFVGGALCMFAVGWVKSKLGIDDSLDVFGVHGVGGIVGSILTGVFASPSLGGVGVFDYVTGSVSFDMAGQVWIQTQGVLLTIAWSGVVSLVLFFILKKTIGLRVEDDDERQGLDVSSHGEVAYHY